MFKVDVYIFFKCIYVSHLFRDDSLSLWPNETSVEIIFAGFCTVRILRCNLLHSDVYKILRGCLDDYQNVTVR